MSTEEKTTTATDAVNVHSQEASVPSVSGLPLEQGAGGGREGREAVDGGGLGREASA